MWKHEKYWNREVIPQEFLYTDFISGNEPEIDKRDNYVYPTLAENEIKVTFTNDSSLSTYQIFNNKGEIVLSGDNDRKKFIIVDTSNL